MSDVIPQHRYTITVSWQSEDILVNIVVSLKQQSLSSYLYLSAVVVLWEKP